MAKKSKVRKPRTTKQKLFLAFIIIVLLGLAGGIGVIFYFSTIHGPNSVSHDKIEFADPIYSTLTGLEISDASQNSSPTYCIQIPNGNDGGRPQAGLHQAAVIFEAIAERGITRFAAIFQNPTTGVIGPIRSLRPYYLDWDTPFDCTVTHAGGSDEAIAALNWGGQRNLDESLTYMWRERSTRAWNNLFTSPEKLAEFNAAQGYSTSNVKAFPRLKPEEAEGNLKQSLVCDEAGTCAAPVASITLRFGATPNYNPVYTYDLASNTYLRSYASGAPHTSYECPTGSGAVNTTTQCGEPTQLAPSVVIAMEVRESVMEDGYHEKINAVSSGNATIFQNGTAIDATWHKSSQSSQIIFRDGAGQEIKLVPGQVWISAIPQYGAIIY